MVSTTFIDTEVEHRCQPFCVRDPKSQLALNRDQLEIGGRLLKNEGDIRAGYWDRDDRGCGRVVDKGESGTLSLDVAMLVLKHVGGWRELYEAKHCWKPP